MCVNSNIVFLNFKCPLNNKSLFLDQEWLTLVLAISLTSRSGLLYLKLNASLSGLNQCLIAWCTLAGLNWRELIFIFCQGVGETNGRRPTNGDLAGFWDMVMIQVIWCGLLKLTEAKPWLFVHRSIFYLTKLMKIFLIVFYQYVFSFPRFSYIKKNMNSSIVQNICHI